MVYRVLVYFTILIGKLECSPLRDIFKPVAYPTRARSSTPLIGYLGSMSITITHHRSWADMSNSDKHSNLLFKNGKIHLKDQPFTGSVAL